MDNIVVLIFKKGDTKLLDNYRGIALINTLPKVYAKTMAYRLADINNQFKIIRKEQTGFVNGEIGLNTVSSTIEIYERRKKIRSRNVITIR
jgi:hypothetical protein